jgi:hypothetical protein
MDTKSSTLRIQRTRIHSLLLYFPFDYRFILRITKTSCYARVSPWNIDVTNTPLSYMTLWYHYSAFEPLCILYRPSCILCLTWSNLDYSPSLVPKHEECQNSWKSTLHILHRRALSIIVKTRTYRQNYKHQLSKTLKYSFPLRTL